MPVDIKILKNKSSLKHLNEEELNIIAKKAVISEHSPNHILFNQGDHDEMTAFLLLGEVELKSADGQIQIMKPSGLSLPDLKPRKYTAKTSKYGTCILWINSKLIKKDLKKDLKKEVSFQQIPSIELEYIEDRRKTPRSNQSL